MHKKKKSSRFLASKARQGGHTKESHYFEWKDLKDGGEHGVLEEDFRYLQNGKVA